MAELRTYDDYMKMPDALPFEEAGILYRQIIDNANTEDEDFEELWQDLMEACVRYAQIRGNWQLISREERMETDDNRTACHNSVITRMNALARCMKMKGWDDGWRERLGADERLHRKRIGDFACYLAYVYSVNAR